MRAGTAVVIAERGLVGLADAVPAYRNCPKAGPMGRDTLADAYSVVVTVMPGGGCCGVDGGGTPSQTVELADAEEYSAVEAGAAGSREGAERRSGEVPERNAIRRI
jgi:hypothetical protein